MKKAALRNILTFVVVFALCFLVKIMACAIPSERIVDHLKASKVSQNIANEAFMPWSTAQGNRIQFWPEYDYLNDCITMDPDMPVYSALMNPVTSGNTGMGGGAGRYDALMKGEENPVSEFRVYTFGAISILRPLLYLFKYDDIVDILIITGWIMIIICAFKILQVSNKWMALIFIGSLLMININIALTTVFTSLVFLTAFLGIICLSHVKNPSYEVTIFLIMGLLTGFFDWFDTPIVTFAYPALYVFLKQMSQINAETQNVGTLKKTRSKGLIGMIKCAVAWCVGYGGMIIGKVIVASVYSKQNILSELFEHFTQDINKDMVDHPDNLLAYIYHIQEDFQAC